MTRTSVIVQARMGSSRLPGKVMMPLAGKTVLAHVLERCQAIPGIDEVCCATVDHPSCNPVAEEARAVGAAVFRGDQDDVLGRYAAAARFLAADIVVRVTSDCPLVDPNVCAAVLTLRVEAEADYACNNMPPSWPHGLDCEAFTADLLAEADARARRPAEREHVTPYMRHHEGIKIVNLEGPGGALTNCRWTLDTEADYRFLEQVFERLPRGPAGWDYTAPLRIVEANPDLRAINPGEDRLRGFRESPDGGLESRIRVP